MLYHVTRYNEIFEVPDPIHFRKATDFGPALYCSFDKKSALEYYSYLDDLGDSPRLLESELNILPDQTGMFYGYAIKNFGIQNNVTELDAIEWVQQVLLARLVAFIDDNEEIPEFYDINLDSCFYHDETYRSLLIHPYYDILIGNRADSQVLNILKDLVEENSAYGVLDDNSCMIYYNRLNPLHFTPQIAFNENACRLFEQYPWHEVEPYEFI